MALNASHQLPVAELHGVVCGLAVCHGEAMPLEDLLELVGVEALNDQQSVEQFVFASVADLQAEDMSFAPLLPEDDAALSQRLEALGQWCGSFLAGLAAGLARLGAGSLDDCPHEVREIVRDFATIAQVDPAASQSDPGRRAAEGEEADLVELEEFVKVGTLLIMTTLSADRDDGRDDDADDPVG